MSDPDPMEEPSVVDDFLGDVNNTSVDDTWDLGPIEDVSTEELPPIVVGDGVCRVCGAPTFRPPGLTKSGQRKRAPRYCELHSPNRQIGDAGISQAALDAEQKRVAEELADQWRLAGTLIGPMLPVTGYFIIDTADPFTTALMRLCKNQQRVMKFLYRTAQVAPLYQVAKEVGGIARCVQVDMQQADAHDAASKALGVDRAYDAVYPTAVDATSYNGQHGNGTVPGNGFSPPPRYASSF
jgi:hypothetical protein